LFLCHIGRLGSFVMCHIGRSVIVNWATLAYTQGKTYMRPDTFALGRCVIIWLAISFFRFFLCVSMRQMLVHSHVSKTETACTFVRTRARERECASKCSQIERVCVHMWLFVLCVCWTSLHVPQCVAVCCKCVAVCCSVLQCVVWRVAFCCSVVMNINPRASEGSGRGVYILVNICIYVCEYL